MINDKDEAPDIQDDLPPDEIAASKQRSRINALMLGVVFLLTTLAPPPWNTYAPVLLIIPFFYALVGRVRRAAQSSKAHQIPGKPSAAGGPPPVIEPYSCTPKDPKDPRRYKPIG